MNDRFFSNSPLFAILSDEERDLIREAIRLKIERNREASEMITSRGAINAIDDENAALLDLMGLFGNEYVWTVQDPDGYCLGTFNQLSEARQYMADYELTAEQGYTLDYSRKDYLTFK